MNNKVKQVLVLLFVVSTLLIMIGSVSANTDDLNENLEASNTLNDDLSVVEVDSGADKDVSNQLTISNIDEKTNGSSQIIGESNSENVVSNYEDTTIDAKDSDNNIIKASNDVEDVLSNPNFIITVTPSSSIVNVGDYVNFDVVVRNTGDTYNNDGKFIGVDFSFDPNGFEYVGYAPQVNPDNGWDLRSDFLQPRESESNKGFTQYAYSFQNYGGFLNNFVFRFIVTLKAKTQGTFETFSRLTMDYSVKSTVSTVVGPKFIITCNTLNPEVNMGDEVNFEYIVRNIGSDYRNDEGWEGINFIFNTDEFEYVKFTPNLNPDNGWDLRSDFLPPKEDNKNNGFVQYAYKFEKYGGFLNNFCFKYTVTLKVKSHGTFGATSQITQFNDVTSKAIVTSMLPSLNIAHTALTPYVNTDDVVSFEIFGRNAGDPFLGSSLVMVTVYNPEELEYVGLTSGVNPDAPWIDFSKNYGNTIVEDGKVVVFYNCDNNRFENGHCFNYTVNFKALKHGIFETHTFSHQGYGVSSTAKVVSSDPNLTITETPSSKTLRVGDDLSFNYVVKNEGSKYNNNYISIEIDFDSDKMQYLGFSEIPNLSFESLQYTSSHLGNLLLGASIDNVLGADSSVGHLKLGYTSENGFDAGSSFNFDVLFKAVTDGKLQNTAQLSGDQLASSKVYGVAYAGDPSLKLTKTPDNEFKNVGDEVSYEIFLVNDGTLHFTDKDCIEINDYYHEGLVYDSCTVNSINAKGEKVKLTIRHNVYAPERHVNIIYNLTENGYDDWAPGSSLNITLHFHLVKTGIICNFVFSEWGTHDVASVAVEEPELNLTKTCLNTTVDLNDLVYYEIYVENTGNISYFDHSNAYGDQFLIIEDIYPDGLKFEGYTLNPDKNGNTWENNYASIEDVGDRVVIKYRTWEGWTPGSSLNITLKFRAVELGKLVNKAHVYWQWKDWGPKESQKEIELNEEAEVVVGQPTFSIEKISNFKEAKVGDTVSFSIVYSNTGNRTITGAYIKDNKFSSGLQYLDFSDKDSWTFDGKDTWYYNGKLEAGQSATLTLFFKALTAGKHSNTALAGHNVNNDTLNDTDTVLIKEEVNGTADTEGSEVEPEEPDEEPDEEPSAPGVKGSVAAKSTIHPTGNPLVVLLISLLTLCFVQRKGKK